MRFAQKIVQGSSKPAIASSSVYRKPTADKLRVLGLAESLVKLIHFFAVRPAGKWRFRQIQRSISVGSASLQRDLERLVDLNVARRDGSGSAVFYSVAQDSRVWLSLLQLVRELSQPEVLVREAVKGVQGVDAAFIYGSMAAGTTKPESDIDLFVVTNSNLDRKAFYRNLSEAQRLTGKEINTVEYSKDQLAIRLASRTRFIREVLQGEKVWVGGDPNQIAPMVVAAGLPATWPSSTLDTEDVKRAP